MVMNNLRAHNVAGISSAINARGANILYLPPYLPDLLLIEQCWSKLKIYPLRTVRSHMHEALDTAMTEAMATITAMGARGWFAHAGCTYSRVKTALVGSRGRASDRSSSKTIRTTIGTKGKGQASHVLYLASPLESHKKSKLVWPGKDRWHPLDCFGTRGGIPEGYRQAVVQCVVIPVHFGEVQNCTGLLVPSTVSSKSL